MSKRHRGNTAKHYSVNDWVMVNWESPGENDPEKHWWLAQVIGKQGEDLEVKFHIDGTLGTIQKEEIGVRIRSGEKPEASITEARTNEQQQYVVERVLDRREGRGRAGKVELQIKWEGYTETTWEPEYQFLGLDAYKIFMGLPISDISTDEESIEEHCEVEAVLDARTVLDKRDGKVTTIQQYKVQWVGSDEKTWEPAQNLIGTSAESALTIFLKKQDRFKPEPVAVDLPHWATEDCIGRLCWEKYRTNPIETVDASIFTMIGQSAVKLRTREGDHPGAIKMILARFAKDHELEDIPDTESLVPLFRAVAGWDKNQEINWKRQFQPKIVWPAELSYSAKAFVDNRLHASKRLKSVFDGEQSTWGSVFLALGGRNRLLNAAKCVRTCMDAETKKVDAVMIEALAHRGIISEGKVRDGKHLTEPSTRKSAVECIQAALAMDIPWEQEIDTILTKVRAVYHEQEQIKKECRDSRVLPEVEVEMRW